MLIIILKVMPYNIPECGNIWIWEIRVFFQSPAMALPRLLHSRPSGIASQPRQELICDRTSIFSVAPPYCPTVVSDDRNPVDVSDRPHCPIAITVYVGKPVFSAFKHQVYWMMYFLHVVVKNIALYEINVSNFKFSLQILVIAIFH